MDVGMELDRADALLEVGRAEQAVVVLTGVLAADPDNGTAWARLSRCYSDLANHTAALHAADQAVRNAPGGDWAHRVRAHCLIRAGNARLALPSGAEAVRLGPDMWINHYLYAEALRDSRQLRAAWQAAVKTRDLAPDQAMAHAVCGDVLHDMYDDPAARAAYERSLALDPDSSHVRHNLAVLALNLGQVTSASAGFSAALAGDPNDELYQKNLHLAARGLLWRQLDLAALLLLAVAVVEGIAEPHQLPGAVAGTAALAGFVWYVRRALRRASAVVRQTIRRRLLRPAYLLGVAATTTVVLAIVTTAYLPRSFDVMYTIAAPALIVVLIRFRNHVLRRLYRWVKRAWYRTGRSPRR